MCLDIKTLAAANSNAKQILKGSGGIQGQPGKDGVGISSIEKISTEGLIDTYQITFTDEKTYDFTISNGKDAEAPSITIGENNHWILNGTDTGILAKGTKGDNGSPGENGADGVGILNISTISSSTTDNGINTYRINLTDGTYKDFSVKNGSKGSTGATGANGVGCTSVALPAGGDYTSHMINTLYHKGAFVGISQCHGAVLAGYNYTNPPTNSADTWLSNISLGCSYWPFSRVYANNTTIQTSDQYKKENISYELEDEYLQLFDNFSLCKYTMKNYENEETFINDKHKRYHFGIIAQDFEKVMKNVGLNNDDFSGLVSNFFAMYGNPRANVSLGWEVKAEGKDYSENTYNWKHRNDVEFNGEYELLNKVEEITISSLHIDNYRKNIGYIMFEDNSKLTKEQPSIYINSILLEDTDGNIVEVPLSDNVIKYYDIEDKNFENPLSNAYINENGQLVCEFSKMYGSVMMKLDESIDITQYEKVIIDYDHISEFKIFFLPEPIETDYYNANVWDRDHNDQILYDYSFAYGELNNLSHYVLQKTRKEFKKYKEDTTELINGLLDRIDRLEEKVNGGNIDE